MPLGFGKTRETLKGASKNVRYWLVGFAPLWWTPKMRHGERLEASLQKRLLDDQQLLDCAAVCLTALFLCSGKVGAGKQPKR